MKLLIFLAGLFLVGCFNKESGVAKVNFPTHIYLESKSPDNITNAIIYSWTNETEDNLLGSEYRFMLGFANTKSTWYIDYELSEGFGTYEGGITGIKWLNNNEVIINRIINDIPNDIKYNIRLNEWAVINTTAK